MLCDICKKNEATIHIKEIHNGQSHTSNLCESCAAEQEKNGKLGALGFNLAEMLHNLGKISADAAHTPDSEERNESVLTCPGCGWTLAKIKHSGGRLGCPECYHTFEKIIRDALSGVQRGTVHFGKRPPSASGNSRAALEAELKERQHELDALVKREEYEQAAACRDRILQLKEELAALDGGKNE